MQKTQPFWAILYVSSAMKDLQPTDVDYFLTVSRQQRKQHGISGIAILAENNVLVLQEGEKEIVKSEFEIDRKHPAQHSLIKLFDGPVESPHFEDFSLAFKTIGHPELNHLDDFNKPSNKEYLEGLFEMDDPIAKLIRDFIKNNS